MLAGLAYAIVGVIELLIGLRFVFQLLGANPNSQIVAAVYDWSQPLVAPFAGILGEHPVLTGPGVVVHSVIDWTSLVALLVYGLVGGVIARILAAV